MHVHARLFITWTAIVLAACRSASITAWPSGEAAVNAGAGSAVILFDDVRVFDGDAVHVRADVLVEGEEIAAIGATLAAPAGAMIVDGRGKTLLPGFIDAHAHVSKPEQLIMAAAFGTTTVLDMFNDPRAIARLKQDASRRPSRASIFSAGHMATVPRGHGDEWGGNPTLTRPDEAEQYVAARIREGADYIKICYDDGAAFGVHLPTLTPDTLRALIEAAHAQEMLAVVHIGSLAGAKTALAAGADGLMHVFADAPADEELLALAATRGAFVVPTLSVLAPAVRNRVAPLAHDARLLPYLWGSARASLASREQTPPAAAIVGAQNDERNDDRFALSATSALHRAHVPILAGTDAANPGVAPGASMHGELALLVEAGLSPLDALRAATSNVAKGFRLRDRGRIAAGLRADLLLVNGDPTVDIVATRDIVGVWHRGAPVDRPALAAAVRASRLQAGTLIDFEDGVRPRVGAGVEISTDALLGGSAAAPSTAHMEVAHVRGRRALAVRGVLVPKEPESWSGVILWTGPHRLAHADLSSTTTLTFRARGDGGTYTVLLFTERGGSDAVGSATFVADGTWRVHSVPLAALGTTGDDVTGIWFGAIDDPTTSAFTFALDDIALE